MTSEQKEREEFDPSSQSVLDNYRRLIEESKNSNGQIHFFAALCLSLIEEIELSRAHQAQPEGELVERVARAINPSAFESYERHIEYRIKEGGTREQGVEFAEWCDNGAHPLNRVSAALEMAKAALSVLPPQPDAKPPAQSETTGDVVEIEHSPYGDEWWFGGYTGGGETTMKIDGITWVSGGNNIAQAEKIRAALSAIQQPSEQAGALTEDELKESIRSGLKIRIGGYVDAVAEDVYSAITTAMAKKAGA